MAAGEQQVAAAAPRLLHVGALEAHRELQLVRQRRRHQHQRQAVAGAGVERLGGGLGGGRVVLELELGAAVERIDQPGLRALGADLVGDVDREIAAHRVAHLEHVVGADPLGRRGEQVIGEQAGPAAAAACWRRPRAGSRGASDRVRMARLRAAAAPPRYITAQMMNRFGRNFPAGAASLHGGNAEGAVDHLGEGALLAEDEALGGREGEVLARLGIGLEPMSDTFRRRRATRTRSGPRPRRSCLRAAGSSRPGGRRSAG